MALTERERQALKKIEMDLEEADRRLADRFARGWRSPKHAIRIEVAGLLVGLTLIVLGLIPSDAARLATAVIGFAVIVLACFGASVKLRRRRRNREGRRA